MRTKQAITTLLACCLFFIFSQSALAKPGGNKPTTSSPAVVINTVAVDYTTNTVEVTGSGLDAVSEILLGGIDVSGAISTSTPNSLTLNLGNVTPSPVTESGNYSLSIDGSAFSVYFSAAIFVDVGATCPCQATWEYFSTSNGFYPIGFEGLTPSSAYDDGSTIQLVFSDTDGFLTYFWILNSTYTADSKQCDMPQDGDLYDSPFPKPVTAVEHAACAEYLRSLIP
jgi:hypothetical protein